MNRRPVPPSPLTETENEFSTPKLGSGFGSGSLFSPAWWAWKWERALGPTPILPARAPHRGLMISGRKKPLDLSPLRLESLEPPPVDPRQGSDAFRLPPGFDSMQDGMNQFLRSTTSNSFHPRLLDLDNTYWVSVPSSDRSQGLVGIVVSMPEHQMPGPRDRLVLRRPSENWPSRWVEVPPGGAFRLPPEIVERIQAPATLAGAAYLGMLAI